MPGWRVSHHDGTHSDDEVTEPFRVICIVQPREKTGRESVRAYPYYVLKDGTWRGIEDLPSTIQQFAYFAAEVTAFAMGIWTEEANFNAIIQRAKHDEGLPRRSADDPDKRR